MTTNTIKQSVIDGYGKLAKSRQNKVFAKLFACCDPKNNAEVVGKKIGYSQAELTMVPEDSNLGVGCGNPSALSNIQLGETVIDLGSGAGFDAFLVSPLVGEKGKVVGVDLSGDMLKLARKNARKGDYSNTQFVKGDIEDLPLSNEIADHVISNCVINLSLNKSAVFKEAFRVLKPGGKLSISDIILEKELPDYIKDSLAGHIACISGAEKVETYMKYIQDAGFQNIEIKSKNNFPLELMLSDPQVMKIATEFNLTIGSAEAEELASRVVSISLTAIK